MLMDKISDLEIILGFIILFLVRKHIKKASTPIMGIVYVVAVYITVRVLISK